MSVYFNEKEADDIVHKILRERQLMSDVLFFKKDDSVYEVTDFVETSRETILAEIDVLESQQHELSDAMDKLKAKLAKFDALTAPKEEPTATPDPEPTPEPEAPDPVPEEPPVEQAPTPEAPVPELQPAPVILQ